MAQITRASKRERKISDESKILRQKNLNDNMRARRINTTYRLMSVRSYSLTMYDIQKAIMCLTHTWTMILNTDITTSNDLEQNDLS